jgi:chromosome segregation ATPase
MKKNILLLPAMIVLTSISIVGCNNSTDDKTTSDVVQKDTIVIEENKKEVTVVVATPEEWNAFKADAEAKIEANEKRIAELKAKINKPGKLLDKMRADRIAALEQRNRDLRLKITAYETEKTDWQKFKEEFNHDVDELGKAIGDIFSDDK